MLLSRLLLRTGSWILIVDVVWTRLRFRRAWEGGESCCLSPFTGLLDLDKFGSARTVGRRRDDLEPATMILWLDGSSCCSWWKNTPGEVFCSNALTTAEIIECGRGYHIYVTSYGVTCNFLPGRNCKLPTSKRISHIDGQEHIIFVKIMAWCHEIQAV